MISAPGPTPKGPNKMPKHIKKTKPNHVIQIGDFLSLDSCCWHIDNATMEARKNKGTFIKDIESFNIALSELDKGLGNYKVKKHLRKTI